MGHRLQILLLSVFIACISQGAVALGLGKITLKSTLNQPLEAEIELLEVRDFEANEILVGMASREDFDRIGVDKIYFLTDLKFKVDLNGANGPIIYVTSRKLVREPFLNFVVEAQWPSGRLLREYTLLMDLPVFSDAPVKAVQPTQSAKASPKEAASRPSAVSQGRQSEYNPRSSFAEGQAQRQRSQPSGPTYTEDSYAVRANDTLWEIAVRVRPDRSISIQQAMLAIQDVNPDAFINGNINLLKRGQVLRIPDRGQMEELTERRAVQEVASQNSSWSGDDSSEAQLVGGNSFDSYDDSEASSGGKVRLSSPDDAYNSSEGRTSGGSSDSSTDAVENELAITLEQLDKSSRENSELRSKIESLESQISTMERMIEVSNEDLRALELSAQKNAEARELSAAEAANDDSFSDDSYAEDDYADTVSDDLSAEGEFDEPAVSDEEEVDTAFLDEETEVVSEDVQIEETENKVAEEPKKIDRSKVVLSAPKKEKGIVDLLLDYILYIVAGIVVLAVGIFFLLKKGSSDEDDFDEFMADHGGEEDDKTVIMDRDERDAEDTPEEEEETLLSLEDGDEVLEDSAEHEEADPETEDVVAEADIYIAYGKYDQAEEMLVRALQTDPNDSDVRLKLLEVYAAQGDAERFDPHYAKLRVSAPAESIERAERLREGIANAAVFDESSFDTSDVQSLSDSGTADLVADSEAGASFESVDFDADNARDSEPTDDSFELDLSGLSVDGDKDEFELPGADEDLGESSLDDSLDIDDLDKDFNLDDLDLDIPESALDDSLDLELDLPDSDADDIGSADKEATSDADIDFSLDDDLPGEEVALEDESTDSDTGSDDLSLSTEDDLELASFDLAEGDELNVDDLDLEFDLDLDAELSLDGDSVEGAQDDAQEQTPENIGSGGLESIDFEFESDETSGAESDDLDLELDLESDGTVNEDSGESLESELASLDSDLDFDLSLEGDDDSPSEPSTEEGSFEAELSDPEDLTLSGLSAALESDIEGLGDELESGEFDVDFETSNGAGLTQEFEALDSLDLDDGSLEEDIAALDSELSKDIESDEVELADSESGDADLELSLDELDEIEDLAGVGEDIDADLGLDLETLDVDDSAENDSQADAGSETVVNEAITEAYIEQEAGLDDLSEEDDLVILDEEVGEEILGDAENPGNESANEQDLDEEIDVLGDIDASEFDLGEDDDELELGSDVDFDSLDDEIELLTGETENEALSVDDLSVEETTEEGDTALSIAAMEEPVTDFGDLEVDGEVASGEIETLDEVLDSVDSEAGTEATDTESASVEEMGEDTMFDQAISEVPETDLNFELPEVDPEADDDDNDLDFLSDSDETGTKLDLARAYIDMGDQDGAKDIIREILNEGNDDQRAEAEGLLSKLDG